MGALATIAGLAPSEIVHVGDGDNDCRAAHEFGCAFIGVDLDGDATFSAPTHAVVRDMHGACAEICKLAGLEPMATHEAPAV